MRFRTAFWAGLLAFVVCLGLLKAQRPFKEYPAIEYENFPLPPDYKDTNHEWVRARLRYPDIYGYPDHSRLRLMGGKAWPGQWTMDYPRSDRHLLQGIRRLTRIDTRSVEQVVDLDGTDDIYNWPCLYAVEVGHWLLPPEEAKQLREYLLRGGFLMVDDFHGSAPYDDFLGPLNEWATFTASMSRVFPNRPIEDIPDNDPIFHTVSDLQNRFQVPGAQVFESGITYEKGPTGKVPHWRCIRDDRGRIMVAICHNMDLGDAWEWSDDPKYQEKWASLAYRIAVNYFIYDLTH
ncbi:MAG TPA: DUF4159 domain-containing protein [Bryobacteraceae bacterium]|jgi:hypothetical protein|nr:DUF4159 domain-containing protein [Bryobacteraceae bacterium]